VLFGESEFNSWRGRDFFLLHSIQTGFGVHPASSSVGTRGFSQELKRPGLEADHSHPPPGEDKKT
jgi:hypothetical protein